MSKRSFRHPLNPLEKRVQGSFNETIAIVPTRGNPLNKRVETIALSQVRHFCGRIHLNYSSAHVRARMIGCSVRTEQLSLY